MFFSKLFLDNIRRMNFSKFYIYRQYKMPVIQIVDIFPFLKQFATLSGNFSARPECLCIKCIFYNSSFLKMLLIIGGNSVRKVPDHGAGEGPGTEGEGSG